MWRVATRFARLHTVLHYLFAVIISTFYSLWRVVSSFLGNSESFCGRTGSYRGRVFCNCGFGSSNNGLIFWRKKVQMRWVFRGDSSRNPPEALVPLGAKN